MEKKSHRTKIELATREKAEANLLSGSKLRENPSVRNNPAAHKEFSRVRRLLRAIEKDDDLYNGQINTYCELLGEIAELMVEKEVVVAEVEELRESRDDFEDKKEFYKLLDGFEKRAAGIDKRIDAKRLHRERIERENGMTVAAALRSIPKKPEQNNSALKKALYGS